MARKLGFCPWWPMWVKPRKTIKSIVDVNPNSGLWILSAFYGFSSLLYLAEVFSLGDWVNFYLILFGSLVLSPLWGYIFFTFTAYVVYLMGKLVRGKGRYKEIGAAVVWANGPMVINAVLWVVLVIFYKTSLFRDFPGGHILSANETTLFLIILLIQLILVIWTLILFLQALSEVQKFSIGFSILNAILTSVVLGVILSLILWAFQDRCGDYFDEPILTLLWACL